MTDVTIPITTGVGADVYVYSGAGNTNYGGVTVCWAKNNQINQLLRFDLSAIPADAIITAATLTLTAAVNAASSTYNIYKIADANGDWIEGIGTGGTTQTGEPCWNKKVYNTGAWAGSAGLQTAGTDYVNTVIATVTSAITTNAGLAIPFNADGLAVLQSWFGDATNNGLLFKAADALGTYQFYSKQWTTAGYRPKITISYTTAAANLTAVDLTLSAVAFDAPTLTNVSGTEDLTATDLTLNPVTFDAPTLVNVWVTPACRTYSVAAESRTFVIPAESRTFVIPAESRGLKVLCGSETKYAVTGLSYNGLTANDLALSAPTFDAPTLVNRPIPLPDPAFSFVPFGISDDGDGTFSIDAAFNLQTHANITVAKTYYVSTTGNDANDGLTWETALRKVSVAAAKADVDRIYIAAGHYGWSQTAIANPARNLVIIGVGNVYITSSLGMSTYIGAFSAVDAHYEAAYTTSIGTQVVDFTQTDANGNYLEYTLKTSAAEVDAAASSYYYNTTTDKICVKTTDGRAPDTNLLYYYPGVWLSSTVANRTVYIENLKIVNGGITFSGAGSKLYIKDCLIDNLNASGVFGLSMTSPTDVILQNVTITRTGEDGVRLNGGYMIQIDCNIHHAGVGLTSGNASSCHGGYPVFVNGHYSYPLGRPIHDIDTGKAWYLGVHAHHAGTAGYPNIAVGSNTFETWCDQCVSSDSDYDFAATLPAKLHKHNCTGDATDTGDGVDNYDY